MTIKKVIQQLKPYDPKIIEADVYLDANEVNTSFNLILDHDKLNIINRYPDHQGETLINQLVDTFGYDKSSVMIGSGSSELLELVIKTFVNPNDIILSIDPTFVMYKQYTTIHGATYIGVKESETLLDDLYQAYKTYLPKVIFISNPNNPTGTYINKYELIEFVKKVNCVVVIDEAYIEYAALKDTLIYNTKNFSNLYVTRTFSKAWGLAGARLGYIVSQPQNIQLLKIAKTPYSVSTLSLQLGIDVLKKQMQVFQNIQEIKETRQSFYENIKGFVEDIQPSYGNFVYVYESRVNLYEKLLEKSIKIRTYNNNFYRITIGTPDEMKLCTQVIKELLYDHT